MEIHSTKRLCAWYDALMRPPLRSMLAVRFFVLLLSGLRIGVGVAANNFTVVNFLRSIHAQQSYECVLLVQRRDTALAEQFFGGEGRVEQQILAALPVSLLQMVEGSKFQLCKTINRNLLVVVQLMGLWSVDLVLLEELAGALNDMRQSRILALLSVNEFDAAFLLQFFTFCWQNKMLNVVVLLADYQVSQRFYTYTPFPRLAIETRSMQSFSLYSTSAVYASRLADMKGFNVSYLLSGADPRVITYVKPNGELFVGGSSGHLLQAFARKHHCNLVEALPLQQHGRKSSAAAMQLVRQGTIEIAAGLNFPEYPFRGNTYPYEDLNACLLIPVEADVPHYEFYLVVFSSGACALTLAMLALISLALNAALHRHGHPVHALELLVHNNCLRGLLAQPFTSLEQPPAVVRMIYVQIFVFGIMLTTFYNAYFSTYLTQPPKQPRIRSLDDLLHSGFKAYIYTAEAEQLLAMAPSYRAYQSVFLLEPNFEKYLHTRDSLDPRYVYVMPTVKRIVVNEQQKTFSRILFRQAEEVCVYRNTPFGFPLQYNSVFAQPLNRVIRQAAEAGLGDYWRQLAFYELIAAGQMHFADLSAKKTFVAMRPDDLRYIWLGMAVMLLIAMLVFVAELCVHRRWLGGKRCVRRAQNVLSKCEM